jgi:choline dehydrogenase-like flavoprotein
MSRTPESVAFDTRKEVDFVIIGSGASGGVLARELSTAGFEVVVLEQGPYRRAGDFNHDELAVQFLGEMTAHPSWSDPQTFRRNASERAEVQAEGPPTALYARGVGGSSVHFTANYWRMRPVDFRERSLLGEISGTGFADWPISYEELEPLQPGRLGNRRLRRSWAVRSSTLAALPGAAAAAEFFRRPAGKGRPQTGLASAARADGHPFAAAQQSRRLHALRFLHGLWLRGQREILHPGGDDSAGGGDRALRDPPAVDCISHRDQRAGQGQRGSLP